MAKVWTYWRCESCGSIIRGDCRSCPNCSEPILNGVKYLMPNNPIVRKAIADGTIKTNADIHVDEKGIVAEVVAKGKERTEANWNCPFCGYQNFATDIVCKGCGAGKESSATDYFGNKTKMSEQNKSDYKKRMNWDYEEPAQKEEPMSHLRKAEETESTSKTSKIGKRLYDIFIGSGLYKLTFVIPLVLFFIWLFIPVTRTSTVTDISWERSISISKWQKFNEDDWSLPPNATLIKTREEVHHHDKVLDHYETKTKKVAEEVLDHYETKTKTHTERVFDGYDTDYIDLGNGQAEMVQTPRYTYETVTETYEVPVYETVYHDETYQEPVYVEVPVYWTKYYYEIWRWKYDHELNSSGHDKNPYWPETDIPDSVSNPKDGDLKQSAHTAKYYVYITDDEGNTQKIAYDEAKWNNVSIGDEITYKTFRFSEKPLS